MTNNDMEMIVMRAKLRYLINNYQLYYDNKVRDYVLIHNDDWSEEHERQREDKLAMERSNEAWKREQIQREKIKKATVSNRDKKLKVPLVCQHCGYTFTSVFTGSFQQHHGDNCRFKPE